MPESGTVSPPRRRRRSYVGFTAKSKPSAKRKKSCEKQRANSPRPSSPGKRSGVGEFLQAHHVERASYLVAVLCRMLGVSKSGYYAWRSRPPSKKSHQDAARTAKIREIHTKSRETYGYPRVHAEFRSLGIGCGRRRVARLMRAAGLRGCMRGRKRRITRRDPRAAPASDLHRKNFVSGQPNRVWLANITYVPTREGFLYLAFILRSGTALDNAMAESFIATLKTELVHRCRFPDREVARSAIFEYLEGFYNHRRRHSALSYQSPMSYEEATIEGVAVA